MERYIVTGMSCAACQARVEKAVSKVSGVTSVSVNLLTNSMTVEGSAEAGDIIRAVQNAGYTAKEVDAYRTDKPTDNSIFSVEEQALKDTDTPKLKKRLALSAVFLFTLMYISMGVNMWHLPLPPYFRHNYLALALTQMILAAIAMAINRKFFTSGFNAFIHRAPNMDTLVALGSSVSFGWSVLVLYQMCGIITRGAPGVELAELYHNQLYFEAAAMIPTLITIGKMLETMTKGKTANALKSLMRLAPKTAVLIINGQETEVPAEEIKVGDIFIVRPGAAIPADAIVIDGVSAVNESALTGEAIPVDKTAGDNVSAATINISGYLKCRAARVGRDTTLAQIIRMVSDAAATKAPIARIADKVSGIFVPAVISIAVIVILGWLVAGENLDFSLARGISVLVISCPCALGLATPAAIMAGTGAGAKNGILFKTSEALENLGKIQIIALDKTGTITLGMPQVTDVCPAEKYTEIELFEKAFSLEKKSEHPLAKAIVSEAESRNISASEVGNFSVSAGNGLAAELNGCTLHSGNEKYIRRFARIPKEFTALSEKFAEQGKTPLFFEENGKFIGIIAVADTIKPDSAEAIKQMKKQGLRVVMLTGDNERTANAIGVAAGVDKVFAGILPEEKQEVIRELQKNGKAAMVGDGINDAPALTQADVGIAVGAGTDVAIDSADIVLMNNSLMDTLSAIRLSRATLKNIKENLFWAFFYNALCIPLAAGLFSWKLNPMFSAAAMSLSSVTVCMNALRLNFFKVKSNSTANNERSKTMTVTVKIKGMMCEHCEMSVKKALENLPFVKSAEVSHTQGKAILTLSGALDEQAVQKAIEDKEYVFIGIDKNQ